MPLPKQDNRRQLRVGILALVGVIALAVGVFISGKASLFTRHYELKLYLPSASDLRNGASVRLDGIPIGNVRRIAISSHTEPSRAVEIDLDVPRKYQHQIRSDSVAAVQSTGLLGEAYVDISKGTSSYPALKNGDELQSRDEPDMKDVLQNANDVTANFRALGANLTDITAKIQHGQGSVGKMVSTRAFSNHMKKTVAEAQNLVNQVNGGHGTLGKFYTEEETLDNKTGAAINRLNQISGQVENGNGTLPELINNRTLHSQLKQVATDASTVMKNIESGKGTIGGLATDQQFHSRVNETAKALDVITTRMAEGKGTLGYHSTNPQFYQNLTSSVESLKEFLAKFRKNPRKFMTLRFHIF